MPDDLDPNQAGQTQSRQPGRESRMDPEPLVIRDGYTGSGKLKGKVALISGSDSGIGRAVAVHFAREGAEVAIAYLEEKADAKATRDLVEAAESRCELIRGDLGEQSHAELAVAHTLSAFGKIDILVNNAAEQHVVDAPEELTAAQVEKTFRSNVFACFHLIQAALPHLGNGSCIINTGSVTGTRGHAELLDYASTKGAIQAMTFSYAQRLASRGIRVNAVAPGRIWTPLIPATFDEEKVASFGDNTLMKRPGQPSEVAPAYVFLASQDASFITGQTIHVNGGGHISA